MKYTFNPPYVFEGDTFEKIECDLDSLKGSDIAAVKRQFAQMGNFAAVPSADSEFCALILARLCKQPLEFFNEMPARDYCALTQEVSNFLLIGN